MTMALTGRTIFGTDKWGEMAQGITKFSSDTVHVSVLAKTENFQITHHDIGSDTTVVTFGFLLAGMGDKGFGTEFCLKNGFNNIYVCNKGKQRYENLSLNEFTDAVRASLQGKKVFTYGASLGAYAAIYYAAHIDARIVAFSPRNSAHPVTGLVEQKFTHSDIADNPVSSHTPIVILDPFENTDFKFLTKAVAPAYKKIQFVHVDNAGHSSFGAVMRSGELKRFLLNIFTGKFQNIHIDDKYKIQYLARKAKALMHSREDAELHIRNLLEVEPSKIAIELAKEFMVKHKQPLDLPPVTTQQIRRSLIKLDNVFTEKTRAYEVLIKTAEIMEETGQFEAALALYSTAQVRWPGSPKVQESIGNLQALLEAKNNAYLIVPGSQFEFENNAEERAGI